jgi:carbonic anhydrase/acetyltransferase-like protein (isoleucine patch superfamily)
MRKYEITNETHPNNKNLKRIRALKDFSNVKRGELGGFIESEKNLDQEGNCWLSGNAKVFRNAVVSGDAVVSGNAVVSGYAKVYGDAVVSHNAVVSWNAVVSGDAVVSWNAVVYGDAEVSGYAKVYGDAVVSDNAQVYGDEKSKPNDNPEILLSLPEEVTSITISGITYTQKVTWVAEEK